ncbi:hypothetical protein MSAN_00288200 [Mycena sanguinolenta]|uniref:Uncharacterized protein n=1 Tax=Mycena sanguinolenta TaxID=230812 RepID=A0A8H6Z7P7_9AGAR|nr:hypothetical protein MSAN_00288200 [Mycena sanguinolenta]
MEPRSLQNAESRAGLCAAGYAYVVNDKAMPRLQWICYFSTRRAVLSVKTRLRPIGIDRRHRPLDPSDSQRAGCGSGSVAPPSQQRFMAVVSCPVVLLPTRVLRAVRPPPPCALAAYRRITFTFPPRLLRRRLSLSASPTPSPCPIAWIPAQPTSGVSGAEGEERADLTLARVVSPQAQGTSTSTPPASSPDFDSDPLGL